MKKVGPFFVSMVIHALLLGGAAMWVISDREASAPREETYSIRIRPEALNVRFENPPTPASFIQDDRRAATPAPVEMIDDAPEIEPAPILTDEPAPMPASKEIAAAPEMSHVVVAPGLHVGVGGGGGGTPSGTGIGNAPAGKTPEGKGISPTGTGTGVGRAAALVSQAKPEYPVECRRKGEQGEVIVSFEVTETGEVRNVEVKKSSGSKALDDAAIASVLTSKYKPALRDGVAVPAADSIRFVFRLE